MTRFPGLAGMAGTAMLAAAMLAAPSAAHAGAKDKQLYIIGVFHADVSNSFSSVVKKGVEQAGKDLNVKVEFVGPDKFDVVAEGQLIEAAIAKKPDGLFVSLPDCDALKPAVQAAIKAGIPVMSFNAAPPASRTPARSSMSPRTAPGRHAAPASAWSRSAPRTSSASIHEVGNAILEDRCKGIGDGAREGRRQEHHRADQPRRSVGHQGRARGGLPQGSRPSTRIGGEWGGGPSPAVIDQTLTELGLQGKVIVSYFDPGSDTLPMIKEGKIAFETSQVPFNQGYLPVEFLASYIRYGVLPGGPPRGRQQWRLLHHQGQCRQDHRPGEQGIY